MERNPPFLFKPNAAAIDGLVGDVTNDDATLANANKAMSDRIQFMVVVSLFRTLVWSKQIRAENPICFFFCSFYFLCANTTTKNSVRWPMGRKSDGRGGWWEERAEKFKIHVSYHANITAGGLCDACVAAVNMATFYKFWNSNSQSESWKIWMEVKDFGGGRRSSKNLIHTYSWLVTEMPCYVRPSCARSVVVMYVRRPKPNYRFTTSGIDESTCKARGTCATSSGIMKHFDYFKYSENIIATNPNGGSFSRLWLRLERARPFKICWK